MVDEKNHLFGPLDMAKDGKMVNKRKTQQQFSRFSTSLATVSSNASIHSNSPAIQTNYNPQIGNPYDDSLGSISADIAISFQTYGSQYSFLEVTNDLEITFKDLPTGRFIEFSLHIEVNQPSGVLITFPQVTNPPLLEGLDGDVYVLKFIGVLRSDPTGVNAPVETYTFLSGDATGGGATQQLHLDLGLVNGTVNIDWSLATLFTMIMTGDVTANFINLPSSPNWQDICLEVQQDSVGGHSLSFAQVMDNAYVPNAIQGALRYSSFLIYTYQLDGINKLQGFGKTAGTNEVTVPGSSGEFNGFAGYVHAKLSLNQLTNLSPGNHVEFDTIVNQETLEIQTGTGQQNGIFQGFTVGHTYLCEGYIAGFSTGGGTRQFSCQFFDRVKGELIGTHAKAISAATGSDIFQQFVAVAYFESESVADNLELRIIDNTGITGIFAGTIVSTPVTTVSIKDCGVTQTVINGAQPAPEDVSLDIREMTYLAVAPNSGNTRYSSWQGFLANNSSPIDQKVSQSGIFKSLIVTVEQKGAGDILFNFRKNGAQFGPLFFLPANTTGIFEFPDVDLGWNRGDFLGWESTGGTGGQPSGDEWNMTMIVWWT